MGKQFKIALAFLYFLQLLVIFRESVADVYKHAAEALYLRAEIDHGPAGIQTVPIPEGFAVYGEHETLTNRGDALDAIFMLGFLAIERHEEIHPHNETEDRFKRPTRKKIGEFLVANLYPMFKKMTVAARTGITRDAGLRLITFPSAA